MLLFSAFIRLLKQADEDQGGGLDIEEFGNALKMAFQHEVCLWLLMSTAF